MKYIHRFFSFWYHFIVGDDWRIAVAVIFGLCFVAYFVHVVHIQVWWLLPAAVVVVLSVSLWLSVRRT